MATVSLSYPSSTIQVTFSGGPGNRTDWVGLYISSASNHSPLSWRYLNNTQNPPATGMTSGTVIFPLPANGTYQIRAFANDTVSITLATSAIFPIPPSGPQASPPGPLTRRGTLDEEKAAYTHWGLTWTAGQEPDGPPNAPENYIPNLGAGQDVHGDFEADDVWQNMVMFQRTGNVLYREMAANWAAYYNNYYETDLISGGAPDSAYGYDHLFGFGLIDWAEEAGDTAAQSTAVRLGEISLANYSGWRGRHPRLDARALLLATRLWEKTGEIRWRDHMEYVKTTVLDNTYLDTLGYMQWNPGYGMYFVWDGVTGHACVSADILQVGWLAWALTRYYEATGGTDTAVRSRLIAMASFARQYALGPEGQSGSSINFFTGSPEYQTGNLHAYTTFWCDILARGYLLTGDITYLDKAKTHWLNGTDATETAVGEFMNKSWLSNTPFYRYNGHLSYAHTFFTVANLTGSVIPPDTTGYALNDNEWLKVSLTSSQRYIPRNRTPATVLESQPDPVAREYGGFHYGDGKLFYFGGGHGGYSGNDVEVYDIAGKVWQQSYNPDVCPAGDNSCNRIYQGGPAAVLSPNGRPYTEHTFQKLSWNPVQGRLIGILGAGTLAYNPATTGWTSLGPTLQGPDISNANLMAFDPDLQATLAILSADNTTQQAGVYRFTSGITGQWQRVGDIPVLEWNAYSTYLPDLHKHFVLFTKNESFWLYDAQANVWTPITSPPDWIDSFDYDTKNHRVIAVQHFQLGTFKVFAYNPSANTWATLPSPASPPPSDGGGPRAWTPLLRYDPIHNVFIFVKASGGSGFSGGTTETWAYRYKN